MMECHTLKTIKKLHINNIQIKCLVAKTKQNCIRKQCKICPWSSKALTERAACGKRICSKQQPCEQLPPRACLKHGQHMNEALWLSFVFTRWKCQNTDDSLYVQRNPHSSEKNLCFGNKLQYYAYICGYLYLNSSLLNES